jgi:hypothetical protein
MCVEQSIDETAAKNISGGDAAWNGDEDDHGLAVHEFRRFMPFGTLRCEPC